MQDEQLYNQYRKKIERYLKRYVDKDNAEDLTQEVFIKVSRSRTSFREESSIETWIYKIATNAAKDYLKSRQKKERDLISETELESLDALTIENASPESMSLAHEMKACIEEFIHRLPHDYSTVLVLSELEGYTVKDIAEIVGMNANAVKVRLHRARAKLKETMDDGCIITHTADHRIVCERKE